MKLSICKACNIIVMGNHNQRLILFPDNLPHQLQHLPGRFRIQISRRLVRKNNLRIHHKGSGYTYALLLASGHGICHMLRLLFQANQLQILHSLFIPHMLWNPTKRQGKCHILYCIHRLQQIVGLKNKSHMISSKSHQLILIHSLHMLSCNHNLAL